MGLRLLALAAATVMVATSVGTGDAVADSPEIVTGSGQIMSRYVLQRNELKSQTLTLLQRERAAAERSSSALQRACSVKIRKAPRRKRATIWRTCAAKRTDLTAQSRQRLSAINSGYTQTVAGWYATARQQVADASDAYIGLRQALDNRYAQTVDDLATSYNSMLDQARSDWEVCHFKAMKGTGSEAACNTESDEKVDAADVWWNEATQQAFRDYVAGGEEFESTYSQLLGNELPFPRVAS